MHIELVFRRLCGLTASCLLAATLPSGAAVVYRYDFGTAASDTEAGYTKILRNTIYNDGAQTPGFDEILDGDGDRGTAWTFTNPTPPTWATDQSKSLISDIVTDVTSGFDIVFRHYVPENATNVTYTIYRSDPGDAHYPNYTTSIAFAGGGASVIDSGTTSGGQATSLSGLVYQPITGSYALPSAAAGGETLDFRFVDNGDPAYNRDLRLGGIVLQYDIVVPEPSSAALILLGSLLMPFTIRNLLRKGSLHA